MKGPAIFLAQFAGDEPPFNSLETIARWAGELGYKGVQIPTWDRRLFDLALKLEGLVIGVTWRKGLPYLPSGAAGGQGAWRGRGDCPDF